MDNLVKSLLVVVFVVAGCGERDPKQACEDMCEKAVTCKMMDPRLAGICKKACLYGGRRSASCYRRTKKTVLCMDDLSCGHGTCAVEIIDLLECWPKDVFNGEGE